MTRKVSNGVTLGITWNADNRPTLITRNGSDYIQYTYDGNGTRVRKVNLATGFVTRYYGEVYEERGTTGVIHLFANTTRIASVRTDGTIQYYHGNHLGSASVITDSTGTVKETIEYLPFGSYRVRQDLDGSFPNVNYTFTDQEDDDETGLYNYRARLYDPLLGRFISADSIVPEPGNLQAFNRYSYCVNNPLVYVDPSGHWFGLDDLVAAVVGAVVGGVQAAATGGDILQGMAIGAAAGWVTYNTCGVVSNQLLTQIVENAWTGEVYSTIGYGTVAMGGSIAGGAAGGAVSGGMNAAFNGGNIGQAMLRGAGFGAVGSAAFGGMDYYYGEEWTLGRATAYAIAGGGMGELSGQGWKSGAMFSGGTAFSRYAYNKIVGYDVTWEPGGDALPKGFTTMPYRGANNIGVQGKALSGRLWDDMWLEGGPVSRAANHIFGVNAVAGMHDVFQVKLDEYIGGWARTIFNVPAMIPAAVITTSGQLATPTGMMQYFCRP